MSDPYIQSVAQDNSRVGRGPMPSPAQMTQLASQAGIGGLFDTARLTPNRRPTMMETSLSEELEEYLLRSSPESRAMLREAALKMPEDRRAGFLASLQQADFEFQVPIQYRMPEGADNIDPRVFRHHDYRSSEIPDDADPDTRSINLQLLGSQMPPYKSPRKRLTVTRDAFGKKRYFPLDPDTVNVYGVGNDPMVIAHEYRHRQGIEGLDRDNAGYEHLNRLQDLLGVENEEELRTALATTATSFRMLGDSEFTTIGDMVETGFRKDAELAKNISIASRDLETPLEELAEGARFFLNHPFLAQTLYRQSIKRRNLATEVELMMNAVRGDVQPMGRVYQDEELIEGVPFKDKISPEDFVVSRFYKENIEEPSLADKLEAMGKRTLQRIKGTLEGIGALPTDKGTPTMKATNKDTERNNAALSKQMREAGLPVNSTADAADIEPEIQEQIDIILDRTDPER
jgi:hypothetical protein